MLLEHLVYSTAIAIVLGTLYRRYTGRDHAWIVAASAYMPDLDIVADGLLKQLGITVMVHGSPIRHGYFHNVAVMLAYAVFVALLLHPAGSGSWTRSSLRRQGLERTSSRTPWYTKGATRSSGLYPISATASESLSTPGTGMGSRIAPS